MFKSIAGAIIILMSLSSCRNDQEDTRSIIEIQREEGYPVTTVTLERQALKRDFYYSGVVEGIRQGDVKTILTDNVERVFVKTGDSVRKNQILLIMDTTNPLARYNQAKTARDLLAKTYDRVKNVYNSGGMAEQKLDEVRAKFEAADADFIAARNALKLTAPLAGVVTDVTIREGETPMPLLPLIRISMIDTVIVKLNVDNDDIQYIRIGDSVKLGSNEEFNGTVSKVALSAGAMNRQFSVEVIAPNPDHRMRPGSYLDCRLSVCIKENALTLPRFALVSEGQNQYVIYAIEQQTARRLLVNLGLETVDQVEILNSLDEGLLIALMGNRSLSDGVKVKIINPEKH